MSPRGNLKKILIADDSEINRELLSDMLSDEYEIIEAENGMEAVKILHNSEQEISLVLLDLVMPVMDGFETLAVMNKNEWLKSIPVIMITSETTVDYIHRAYELGVQDYISRPFDGQTVRRRVVNTIMLFAKQKELSHMLMDQIIEKENDTNLMIEILSNIVEFRNAESGMHVLHIRTLTEMLLERLLQKTDRYEITRKDIPLICNASALHDIGKITIPVEILNKPGRLTQEEYEIMKTHALEGAQLLQNIPLRENEGLVRLGYQICRWHHERYDGRGYLDGLAGEDIPMVAQVVSLADVYDALTSERAYKKAFSHEKAMEMILNGECGIFNPLLLSCLEDISDKLKIEFDSLSINKNIRKEVLNSVDQIMEKGNMDASERTVKLLERERIRYHFFANLSQEVQFEYTTSPEMLVLTDWGAHYLGMPEIIANPREEAIGNTVFAREDFEELLRSLANTTPENPVVRKNYILNINGKKRKCQIIARSMWNNGWEQEYIGAIGKIVEIDDKPEEKKGGHENDN